MKGIDRNVTLLGVVSLLTDLGSQMVFPLVPLYLTSVLAAPAAAVGAVEGAATAVGSLLKVVSGFWSDRVGKRKPFILAGYGFSGLAKPLLAFATAWPWVLAIRSAERIGKGLRNAPRDALVAESTSPESRGKAFGFQRAMDGVGSVLGVLLAVGVLSAASGAPAEAYRAAFLASAIPAVLAVLVILAVREPARAERPSERAPAREGWSALPAPLRRFTVASALFAFGHFGYAFLLLRAQAEGLADREALLLYAAFYAVYAVVSTPLGVWSDRWGRKRTLQAGYALFIAIAWGLATTAGATSLALAFAAYGVFYAIVDGGQKAFVTDLCPPHLKGTALGAFHTAIGLVALPGGLTAGFLWDAFGPRAPFAFGGAVALLALGLLSTVEPPRARPSA